MAAGELQSVINETCYFQTNTKDFFLTLQPAFVDGTGSTEALGSAMMISAIAPLTLSYFIHGYESEPGSKKEFLSNKFTLVPGGHKWAKKVKPQRNGSQRGSFMQPSDCGPLYL